MYVLVLFYGAGDMNGVPFLVTEYCSRGLYVCKYVCMQMMYVCVCTCICMYICVCVQCGCTRFRRDVGFVMVFMVFMHRHVEGYIGK